MSNGESRGVNGSQGESIGVLGGQGSSGNSMGGHWRQTELSVSMSVCLLVRESVSEFMVH